MLFREEELYPNSFRRQNVKVIHMLSNYVETGIDKTTLTETTLKYKPTHTEIKLLSDVKIVSLS